MATQISANLPATFGQEGFGGTVAALDAITPPTGTLTVTGIQAVSGNQTVGGTLAVTGVLTPSGGIAAGGGLTASPRCFHTGGVGATQTTDGNDTTPSVTETYFAEVFVPARVSITGIAFFNGSAVGTDKWVGILYNSSGVVVANTALAGTTAVGTDAYQKIDLTAPYTANGPATFYIGLQCNGTTARFNTHILGTFGADKKTSEVFGTPTTITVPTAFVTARGPMASVY